MTLWNLNKFLNISVFITLPFCILISHVTVVESTCNGAQKVRNFEFEDHGTSLAPAKLVLTKMFDESAKFASESRIVVTATNITEDFYVSLIANLFVKNKEDCDSLKRTGNDINSLRIHKDVCLLRKNFSNDAITFYTIFNGCYHFVMTSKSSGKHYQHDPVFYNETHSYYDTSLKLERFKFKPENTNSSMGLKVFIEAPLTCALIKIRLWELKENIENKPAEKELNRISPALKCELKFSVPGKVSPNCTTNLPTGTDIEFKLNFFSKYERGWTGILEWENLSGGGWWYFVYLEAFDYDCDKYYEREAELGYDLTDWRLMVPRIYEELGYIDRNNAPFLTPGIYIFPWFPTACGSISAITLAILTYWIKKYRNLLWQGYGDIDEPGYVEEPVVPLGETESDQILLMYENGSGLFMKEMENLRNDLETNCSGFNIHDVYAINEWNRVRQLGAPGWVQELFKNGSKIVWVDTLQFRSRLNKKAGQNVVHDFRDDAVLFAVTVATDSFQDSVTQYRRHFVVRVKADNVRDGNDDPLQIISPHTRYYLPEQFDLLCNDLKGPMKLMEN